MPKDIKSTNSAETEKVTDATAAERRAAQNEAVLSRSDEDRNKTSSSENPDQRATDQDAALEQAFVAGTLPEEDRRRAAAANLSEAGNKRSERPTLDAERNLNASSGDTPPLPGDPNPQTVVTNRAIPAGRRQFIGPDGTQQDINVAMKEEHGIGRMIAALPPNTLVTWSNRISPTGIWRVERGSVNTVGEGPTLRRAIRMVGAKMGRHPEDQLRTALLDEQERPIHPHPGTDPDPTDPTDQPKTVDGQGNVVEAVSAVDSQVKPAVVETDETKQSKQPAT